MKVTVLNNLKYYTYTDVIQVTFNTDEGVPELDMKPSKLISILTRDKRVARFELDTAIVTINEEELKWHQNKQLNF